MLHTSGSSTCTVVEDKSLADLVVAVEENSGEQKKETNVEGTVISIDMSSLAALHLCARCSASVDIESGFYCCSSCQMMGTMDSVNTCIPKIGCFRRFYWAYFIK